MKIDDVDSDSTEARSRVQENKENEEACEGREGKIVEI